MRKFKTDAKLIKNGMTFSVGNKLYLKVGNTAIVIDPSKYVDFKNLVKNNNIKYIFKSNGIALVEEVAEDND
jgi:hypothetical protein